MENRNKLEFELNQPKEVQLLYDQPITGENRYGQYNLYALIDLSSGEEVSFFAPDTVHEELKNLKQGDKAVLTKTAQQNGNKVVTGYEVRPSGKSENTSTATTYNGNDSLYTQMLSSYEDAMRIQEQLNGMCDVNRIAITLFIARSKGNGYSHA